MTNVALPEASQGEHTGRCVEAAVTMGRRERGRGHPSEAFFFRDSPTPRRSLRANYHPLLFSNRGY